MTDKMMLREAQRYVAEMECQGMWSDDEAVVEILDELDEREC